MFKLNTLAVVLVVMVLCTASIVATLAYLSPPVGETVSTVCLGGPCITTSSVTITQTQTTTTSETSTEFVTLPITATITTTSHVTTTLTESCCILPPPRLGFWIDERDMWSGVGLDWTPQQFVTNYFEAPPYPSAMLFSTSMTPTGVNSPGALGEAQWLSEVATLAQSGGLNVKILILFFVNLSGSTINGVPDQTSLLTQYLTVLGYHSNIYGAEYEREYYGNTAAEELTFFKIVTAAGYVDILNPGEAQLATNQPYLDYSTFPYFNGTIPNSLPSGNQSIGVGYGETGPPIDNGTLPVWTQASVRAIIDTSPANPYILIYAGSGGTGQPDFQLWNWSTLRTWIWTDTYYQANFITS